MASRGRGFNTGARPGRFFESSGSNLNSRIGTENSTSFTSTSGASTGPVTYNSNTRGRNTQRARRGLGTGRRGGGQLRGSHISEDKDGDLEMGAAYPSTGATRHNPYGRGNRLIRNGRDIVNEVVNDADKPEVVITGYNGAPEASLITYLIQKSKLTWKPISIRYENDVMYMKVQTMAIAMALKRLDGYKFNRNQLSIKISSPDVSQTNIITEPNTIETLREFLLSRWNGTSKFLNLDRMASDLILTRAGILPPGTVGASKNTGAVMMKLAKELFVEVDTISFASNRLRNVQAISSLAQFLPSVKALSLKDNEIASYPGLEALSGPGKLKELKELILEGNPLKQNELRRNGDEVTYRSEITRLFPSLRLLDGAAVQAISFDIEIPRTSVASLLPTTVKGDFFDSDDTKRSAFDFLGRYLSQFDANRSSLLDVYDSNAFFSISINTTIPQRARQDGRRWEASKHGWDGWFDFSRNLMKLKDPNKRISSIHKGNIDIVHILGKLPPTEHDLKSGEKYVIDAYLLKGFEGYPGGFVLFIMMHGEFFEVKNQTKIARSFDRTFIVAPSTPGSKAHAAGSPYIILSDQLNIRWN